MFAEGASKRLFVGDPDSVRDCTGRLHYETVSKVPRCTMVKWAMPACGVGKGCLKEEDSGLELLGSDQLLVILQQLPVQAVLSFGMTCKRFRGIADTDALWAVICKREWGSRAVESWPTFAGRHRVGWQRLYRQMLILNAAAWHRVQQGDIGPPPRASHSVNFLDGNIVVFGGGCHGGRHLNDSWIAKIPEHPSRGIVWQQVYGPGPSGRFGQSCFVVGNVLMLYGGINDHGTRLGDTWISRVGSGINEERLIWQQLEVVAQPPPRGAHDGCSAGDSKVVIFGGIASDGTRLCDTWYLDLAETPHCWREIVVPVAPRARSGHTLTWVGGNRVILFGGRGADFEVMNDVWILDLESECPAWVELHACEVHGGHDRPTPRAGHSATLILGGRILIFGGEDSKRCRKGDVWVLDPKAGFPVARTTPCLGGFTRHRTCANSSSNKSSRRFWKKLKQFGWPPSKRSFHGACAVETGHVVLMFGGMVDGQVVPAVTGGLGFDAELHMLQLVP